MNTSKLYTTLPFYVQFLFSKIDNTCFGEKKHDGLNEDIPLGLIYLNTSSPDGMFVCRGLGDMILLGEACNCGL